MNAIFQKLISAIVKFAGLDPWLIMFRTNDYHQLHTLSGIVAAVGPLIPLLILIEIVLAIVNGRFSFSYYKNNIFILLFNSIAAKVISLSLMAFCINVFRPYALFKISNTWYWFVYSYVVWEFTNFLYHYLGHKVRLLWCMHSVHHAPEHLNLTVDYAHFFLEIPYTDFVRTTICILLGVPPPLLFLVMVIDGVWGTFIHAGENLLKDGRLGALQHYIITPSHHRVHHARNPEYMDKNFCNFLNIWDHIFKTHQQELPDVPPDYGITRPIKKGSFWDMYFGEFRSLFKDVYKAPGLKNKFLYIFMSPGWSHDGSSITVRERERKLAAAKKNSTIRVVATALEKDSAAFDAQSNISIK